MDEDTIKMVIDLMREGNVVHVSTQGFAQVFFCIGQHYYYGVWWTTIYKVNKKQELKPVKGYKNFMLGDKELVDWFSRLDYRYTHYEYTAQKAEKF